MAVTEDPRRGQGASGLPPKDHLSQSAEEADAGQSAHSGGPAAEKKAVETPAAPMGKDEASGGIHSPAAVSQESSAALGESLPTGKEVPGSSSADTGSRVETTQSNPDETVEVATTHLPAGSAHEGPHQAQHSDRPSQAGQPELPSEQTPSPVQASQGRGSHQESLPLEPRTGAGDERRSSVPAEISGVGHAPDRDVPGASTPRLDGGGRAESTAADARGYDSTPRTPRPSRSTDPADARSEPRAQGRSRPSRSATDRPRRQEASQGSNTGRLVLTEGDLLEVRVAQVWFWEGAWARRGVLLRRHYGADSLDVTDLDLVAYNMTATLNAQMTIGEAKTGTSKNAPRPLDRVIWLAGLLRVVPAVGAELTSAIVPDGRVRRLASGLGVRAQSVDDLSRREIAIDTHAVDDTGSHGTGIATAWIRTQSVAAKDPDLNRAYWYLRSDVFAHDPWAGVKGVMALVRLLSRRLAPAVQDEEQEAVRMLLSEAISIFALLCCQLAATALTLPGDRLVAETEARLSEGAVPLVDQRRLADAFDKYLLGLLTEAGLNERAIVGSTGAFHPRPPDYAEAFADLLRRLAQTTRTTRNLPRTADLITYERVVRRRELRPDLLDRLGAKEPLMTVKTFRLLIVFLEGQVGLPRSVSEVLLRN